MKIFECFYNFSAALDISADRHRAVFKWLSKVITWLRLLSLVIGLKDSRQFFNQWESKPKPKPIAPCTRDFSRASSELQVVARNCDWFFALPAPVVIGRSNCFGFGFSTVNWKLLYNREFGKQQRLFQRKRHFKLKLCRRTSGSAMFLICTEGTKDPFN